MGWFRRLWSYDWHFLCYLGSQWGHAQPLPDFEVAACCDAALLPLCGPTGMRWKKGKVENLLCRIVEEVANFRWNCGCVLETSRLSDWWEPHFLGHISLNVTGRGQIVMVMTSMTTLVGLYIPYRCTRPQNGKWLGSIQSCFCHGNSRVVREKPWRTLPSFPGNFDSYDET